MREILPYLLAIVGLLVGYLLNRKKTGAEIEDLKAKAAKSVVEGAMVLVEELRRHCADLKASQDKAKEMQDEAKIEIEELRTENAHTLILLERAKCEHQIELDELTKQFNEQSERLKIKEQNCTRMQREANEMQQKADRLMREAEQLKLKIAELTGRKDS